MYVGKTVQNPKRRFNKHKSDAKKLKHIYLYRSINKYGIENFSFSIIEECDNSILDDREKYWIEKLDTFYNGYNSTLGGDGGLKHSKKDHDKWIKLWNEGMTITEIAEITGDEFSIISQTLKEADLDFKKNTQSKITKRIRMAKGVPVKQYDLDGNFLKEYETESDAARAIGCASTMITASCKNHSYTAHGYLWRFSDDNPPKVGIHYGKKRKVRQYDMSGNFIAEYPSLAQAARETQSTVTGISASVRGVQKNHNGFMWEYV